MPPPKATVVPLSPVSQSPTLQRPPHDPMNGRSPQDQLSSMQANSGAAFVRGLALALDPIKAPRMHSFAWNVFLGERHVDITALPGASLVDLLSLFDMETLARVYFEKVDPCYGFIDRSDVYRHIKLRWASLPLEDAYDAVLCGIAALGCLFSRCQPVEVEANLAELARVNLERRFSEAPDINMITAWVLRVAYLRMTSPPHTAWIASCHLMHLVEAACLHCEPLADYVLQPPTSGVEDELRRRVYAVAAHLNNWISFDVGRSRVVLRNATTVVPSPRPGDYTVELMSLLTYFDMLDPGKTTNSEELAGAMVRVLERIHSEPPSILAQVNLVLCLYRRLRAANNTPTTEVMDQMLTLTSRAIRSAQVMLNNNSPWHHLANVPFQIICTLLAIDTPASLAQLEDAVQTLENVATTYQTNTLFEAVRTASLIISLHQRRKETDIERLGNVLKRHPVTAPATRTPQNGTYPSSQQHQQQSLNSPTNPLWLDEAVASIPYLQNFDIDDFLCEEYR